MICPSFHSLPDEVLKLFVDEGQSAIRLLHGVVMGLEREVGIGVREEGTYAWISLLMTPSLTLRTSHVPCTSAL